MMVVRLCTPHRCFPLTCCVGVQNNQHDLGELQEPDLMKTPFAKAIALEECEGVVSALDSECTPLSRVWCVLEIHAGTKVLQKPLDVATMIAPSTAKSGISHFDSARKR